MTFRNLPIGCRFAFIRHDGMQAPFPPGPWQKSGQRFYSLPGETFPRIPIGSSLAEVEDLTVNLERERA